MAVRKLLIANRGEIAVRIIRTCREMGIRTVAVYSDADEQSVHKMLADEAVRIGPPEAAESYLSIEKILEAARATGADAIHPGYGFLSERAEFSEACAKAGLIFVGPTAPAMRRLGDKISAKQLAVEGAVPIVPGFFKVGATHDELESEAKKIGFPVMLKAAAGGGGRGMRVVRETEEFNEALAIASDEALKAFGDGAMMVEKLVEKPRHVEVQVLADSHGNVACLFERECSIQRRHQKLIEEAPSPLFSDDAEAPFAWEAMRDAAIKVVQLAGYTNAGTIEFIVDGAAGAFYFLEVNARLQVEHPVTEAVTGLDLVRWQIRIAQGEPLDLPPLISGGDRAGLCGAAIEVRVIAEDPARNFMPSAGRILGWAEPKAPGIRVNTGFAAGTEVPQNYDSLIAKVIAHGETRGEAIARLEAALLDFHVLGIRTNIGFLLDVIRHPDFVAGDLDTGFLARHYPTWASGNVPEEIGALSELALASPQGRRVPEVRRTGAWELADGFRNTKGP